MPFDRIIYFGDSLTDSDEFFNLSSQLLLLPLPSAIFGYDGQFSNGDVYADIAPEILGIGADESLNYAVGGARAVGLNPVGQFLAASPLAVPNPDPALVAFDSNLFGQLERFAPDASGLGDLSNSAASVFIGLNDFNGLSDTVDPDPANFDAAAFAAQAQQLAADILTSTLTGASTLISLGVGTIILNTLPVASFFPLTQGLPDFAKPLADQLVRDYNAALVVAATALEGDTKADHLRRVGEFRNDQVIIDAADALEAIGQAGEPTPIVIVDLAAMTAEVSADGQTFGFLNTTDSFYIGTGADPEFVDPDGAGPLPPVPVFQENPAVAGLDDDQFAFWDLLHPTTALHGVMGAFQAASLSMDSIQFLDVGNDRQRFSAADELAFGGDGDDTLFMKDGTDVAFGGLGADRIWGGRDDDILSGGSDNDRLFGLAGSDVLAGNTGNDRLGGHGGDDLLIGGLGSDIAKGGAGDDVFLYTDAALIGGTTGQDRDIYVGGSGQDTLYLVVSEAEQANTQAIIDAGSSFGQFRFTDLGLRTVGIEEVVLLDSRDAFHDIVLSAGLQDQADQAEFWGLV